MGRNRKRKKTIKLMIAKFQLLELKCDFMGYSFNMLSELSYHHLLIGRKVYEKTGLYDDFGEWNCAVLNRNTSHSYLHTIANYDYDIFTYITLQMLNEKEKGYIDLINLKRIEAALESFEREYFDKISERGKEIVQERYLRRILYKPKD